MHEHLFFLDTPLTSGAEMPLPREESRHIARVLRFGESDAITLTDGQGQIAEARITEVGRDEIRVRVEAVTQAPPAPLPDLHLLAPWMKQPARLETLIEKAMELGAASMTVFACPANAVKKQERLERIIIAAAKQSGATRLMALTMTEAPLSQLREADFQGLLLSERPDVAPLREILGDADRVQIAVGPESGLSDEEENALMKQGWERVSLGPRRLRTETAAMTALAAVRTLRD